MLEKNTEIVNRKILKQLNLPTINKEDFRPTTTSFCIFPKIIAYPHVEK